MLVDARKYWGLLIGADGDNIEHVARLHAIKRLRALQFVPRISDFVGIPSVLRVGRC